MPKTIALSALPKLGLDRVVTLLRLQLDAVQADRAKLERALAELGKLDGKGGSPLTRTVRVRHLKHRLECSKCHKKFWAYRQPKPGSKVYCHKPCAAWMDRARPATQPAATKKAKPRPTVLVKGDALKPAPASKVNA